MAFRIIVAVLAITLWTSTAQATSRLRAGFLTDSSLYDLQKPLLRSFIDSITKTEDWDGYSPNFWVTGLYVVDLNGDGFYDVIQEIEAPEGRVLAKSVDVFLFDSIQKKFILSPQLTDFHNPTFYLKRKTVTGFIFEAGGGTAVKLRWNGLKLDTIEFIDFSAEGQEDRYDYNTYTKTEYLSWKKHRVTHGQYHGLPREYRQSQYTPFVDEE